MASARARNAETFFKNVMRMLRQPPDIYPDRPFVTVVVPGLDRGAEILQTDHTIDKAIGLRGIVRRAKLEHELMFLTEIDLRGHVL